MADGVKRRMRKSVVRKTVGMSVLLSRLEISLLAAFSSTSFWLS